MSLWNIFGVAGSGMSAQTMRLNTTASNLSNADIPAKSADQAYKARYPVFQAALQDAVGGMKEQQPGVKVTGLYESNAEARKVFNPNHPMSDKEGYVYFPNVNVVEEMANMISASRSYQMNVQVMSTTKQMLLRTLQLGQ